MNQLLCQFTDVFRRLAIYIFFKFGVVLTNTYEELHSLYRSPNIARVIKSKRLRWAGHLARMEKGRSAFKILTGTPAGKRHLGRPRCRWEDNIRMDLKETCIKTKNWVDSSQDRDYRRALVNAALNLRVL